MLVLTPKGQQAAENTEGKGADYAVLSLLYETGGPIDFEEVMDHLKSDEVKTSLVVHRLINQGLVKEA